MKNYNDYMNDKITPCDALLSNRLRALHGGMSADKVVSFLKGDDIEFFEALFPLMDSLKEAIARRLSMSDN